MKQIKKILIVLFICVFGINCVFGQKKSREQFKAMHVAFITQKLDLTTAESEMFWPIYNDHNKKLWDLKKKYNLRKYKEELNGTDATEVLKKINEYRISETELKTELSQQLVDIVPPDKIVKLYYAEIEFREEILKDLRNRHKDRQEKKSNDQP